MKTTNFEVITSYLDDGRVVLKEGRALLDKLRRGERPGPTTRALFEALREQAQLARSFATTAEYGGFREPLETLAAEFETLRRESLGLL